MKYSEIFLLSVIGEKKYPSAEVGTRWEGRGGVNLDIFQFSNFQFNFRFLYLIVILVPILFQLLLAVSACERPVTPSSTFTMLPSVTSFIRASDSQVCKNVLAHAQQKAAADSEETKEEKMETESGTAGDEKEDQSSLCLFEIQDSEVCEHNN